MAILNNVPGCSTYGNNLGWSPCQFKPGIRTGLYGVPKGTQWTATQLNNLQATINAGLNNTNPALRHHIITGFQGNEAANTDQQEFTYPSGKKVLTRATVVGEMYELDNNMCQYRNLERWNDGAWQNYDFYIITPNALEGRVGLDGSGNTVAMGYTLGYFYVPQWDNPTQSEPARFKMRVEWADATQRTRSFASIPLMNSDGIAFTLATTAGTQDVVFANVVASGTPGVYIATLLTGCQNVNFVSVFSASLVAAMFKAANGSPNGSVGTGATITITSIAPSGLNVATGIYSTVTITLDTTDTDYPASGLPITLNILQAAMLTGGIGSATNGMGSYAGVPVQVAAT